MAFTHFYKINPQLGMVIENSIYNGAQILGEGQYQGGSWGTLTELVSYPVDPEVLNIGFDGNYVEPKEITNKAFGVYVALVVYNQLCWANYTGEPSKESEFFGELYHKVRYWLMDEGTKHGITEDEVNHILRMID